MRLHFIGYDMIERVMEYFGSDSVTADVSQFNEILSDSSGSEHEVGVFCEQNEWVWERVEITEITGFTYVEESNELLSVGVNVETMYNGEGELRISRQEVEVLSSYVPAETVEELVGCVIPVFYSKGKEHYQVSCESGYVIAQKSDFEHSPSS